MHLIFDFDGVLGDTQAQSARATAHIQHISYEEACAQNLAYSSQKPNHTRNHSLSPEALAAQQDWTDRFGDAMHAQGTELFTEFVSIVEALPTPHKAVVSSGSPRYIIPALSKTTIHPTHTLTYDDHHSKEEKIERIAADWGVPVSAVHYFTDTLADVFELRDLLAVEKLIGVGWGYCGATALTTVLDPKYILEEPADIHRVL